MLSSSVNSDFCTEGSYLPFRTVEGWGWTGGRSDRGSRPIWLTRAGAGSQKTKGGKLMEIGLDGQNMSCEDFALCCRLESKFSSERSPHYLWIVACLFELWHSCFTCLVSCGSADGPMIYAGIQVQSTL